MSNGTTGTTNPFSTAASAFTPTLGKIAGQEQTLASYAAPYITDMLGKTAALSNQPYQTYQGPLTAGSSPLQMQAFQGIGGLAPSPGLGTAQQTTETAASRALGSTYTPTQFQSQYQAPTPYTAAGESFTSQGIAGQYMNPYLQQALQPQLEEMRRQADISRMQNAARMSKAGAFGGSRQAILESELNRNLMQQMGRTTGEAYASAYDKAMAQFNAEQARKIQEAQFGATQGMTAAETAARFGQAAQQMGEQSRQYGAGFGLDALSRAVSAAQAGAQIGQGIGAEQRANLAQQLAAGAQQREIESQGIAADLAEFEKQRQFPYQQLQFQQAMLQGLPVTATNYTYQEPSPFSELLTGAGGLEALYKTLFPTAPKG